MTKIIENEKTRIFKRYVQMVVDDFSTGLICKSRAGLGKTQMTLSILEEANAPYYHTNTYSTPLALYKMLFHNNGKIIVLDDMEMILENNLSVSILKSALDSGQDKRMIHWHSTTTNLEEVPQRFEFKGKLIMLVNEIRVKDSPSFEALLSRTTNITLTYSFDETKAMANTILNERDNLSLEQKRKTNEIIDKSIAPFHDFNFRLLERLIKFVRFDIDEAEELFLNSINVDSDYRIVWKLMLEEIPVAEQVQKFTALTGKGRTTYFSIKKKIEENYK